MAGADMAPDSDAATIIEIKGGSLVSFAPSLSNNITLPDSQLAADEADRAAGLTRMGGAFDEKPPSESRLFSASSGISRTSAIKPAMASKTSSLRNADGSATLRASKSRVTVLSASKSTTRVARSAEDGIGGDAGDGPSGTSWRQMRQQRQRSLYSLAPGAGSSEGDADGDGGGGMGDSGHEGGLTFSDRPSTLLPQKIPEGMAKLLRELPDPRDLAPLVRSVVISADKPSRHVLHFKSTTKVQRVGLRTGILVARAARMKLGRKRQEGQGTAFEPTYRAEPKEVPSWRKARGIVKDVLAAGLKDVVYSSFLAENGSRVLAASIVQRLKKENFDRYRLVAKVRIAQKKNQGMAMFVACLWNADVDRFSYVEYENSSLCAQAVLFLVYLD